MRRLSIILGLVCVCVLNCHGQNDPLTLAKMIFARETFTDLDKHVTGEYKGRPNGTDLPKNVTTNFELLDETNTTAVVAMTIVDSAGNAFDTYLHFVNEDVWKVTALRALAVTGIYSEIIARYEKMTQAQRDSLDVLQKKMAKEIPGYSYKPNSMEWTFKNAKLLLSSDKDLIDYFKINKQKFEVLRDALLMKGFLQSSKSLAEFDASNTIQPQLDDLLIDNVGRAGSGSSKNLEFIIGGMVDNSVGYFYLKDKKNKPFMSTNGYIMIREIGNGWYLFKTT